MGIDSFRIASAVVLVAVTAFLVPSLAWGQIPEFDRADWGRWSLTEQTGAGGCRWDTRHLLLHQVGLETSSATLTTREVGGVCRVETLTIVDRYTGIRIVGPASKIDVDHLVPLAEAHRSGGWAWDAEKRLAFWNDPFNLVPVHESTNSSKSDIDPGGESQRGRRSHGWWPPDASQRCWYAQRWIEVKSKWGLAFDAQEFAALFQETSCWRDERPTSKEAAPDAAAFLVEPAVDDTPIVTVVVLIAAVAACVMRAWP